MLLQQIPIDGAKIGHIEFGRDRAITIFSKDGKKVLGRFTHISHSLSGAENAAWMTFSVALDSGEMDSLGMCFGSVGGRGERPVNMTRIDTVRIDRVYE